MQWVYAIVIENTAELAADILFSSLLYSNLDVQISKWRCLSFVPLKTK